MFKSKSISKKLYKYRFCIIFFLGLAVLPWLIHPTLISYTNWGRSRILDRFLANVITSGNISPETYWEFRERYSAGNVTFNEKYIDVAETLSLNSLEKEKSELLYFESPYLTSTDAVIDRDEDLLITSLVTKSFITDLLFESDNEIVYRDDKGYINLIFVKSVEDMKRVNGFFNYTTHEKELLDGNLWLNTTIIKL